MLSKIEFVVPGNPIAQPRQRHARRGNFITNYTPAKHPVNSYKKDLQDAARLAYDGEPVSCGIFLQLTLIFPRQKSKVWKTKPMPRYPHLIKPDVDNVVKAVKDALSGIIYVDDCQVDFLYVSKFYASGDEEARTLVFISESGEEDGEVKSR